MSKWIGKYVLNIGARFSPYGYNLGSPKFQPVVANDHVLYATGSAQNAF